MAVKVELQIIRCRGSDMNNARTKFHAYGNIMGWREAALTESNRELAHRYMSVRSG